jgi:hypothetical protein
MRPVAATRTSPARRRLTRCATDPRGQIDTQHHTNPSANGDRKGEHDAHEVLPKLTLYEVLVQRHRLLHLARASSGVPLTDRLTHFGNPYPGEQEFGPRRQKPACDADNRARAQSGQVGARALGRPDVGKQTQWLAWRGSSERGLSAASTRVGRARRKRRDRAGVGRMGHESSGPC